MNLAAPILFYELSFTGIVSPALQETPEEFITVDSSGAKRNPVKLRSMTR